MAQGLPTSSVTRLVEYPLAVQALSRSWYFSDFLREASTKFVSKHMVNSTRITTCFALLHSTKSGRMSVKATDGGKL